MTYKVIFPIIQGNHALDLLILGLVHNLLKVQIKEDQNMVLFLTQKELKQKSNHQVAKSKEFSAAAVERNNFSISEQVYILICFSTYMYTIRNHKIYTHCFCILAILFNIFILNNLFVEFQYEFIKLLCKIKTNSKSQLKSISSQDSIEIPPQLLTIENLNEFTLQMQDNDFTQEFVSLIICFI